MCAPWPNNPPGALAWFGPIGIPMVSTPLQVEVMAHFSSCPCYQDSYPIGMSMCPAQHFQLNALDILSCNTPSKMVHCISAELKEAAITMSLQGSSDTQICQYTGISKWSLECFHSERCRIKDKVPQPLGWPCMLSTIDVKVSMLCLDL